MAGILRLNNTSNTGQTTLTSIASTDRTINLPDADGTLLISTSTTQQATLPDGIEPAPGITFTNDLDTGIYRPGTNEIGLVTGATERLRIDDSGNVGISTTNPAALLHVTNTSTRTYSGTAGIQTHLFVDTSNSSGDNQCSTMYFRASGNGTTNNARGFINLIQPTATSNGSEFAFQLRNTDGNIVETMRMDRASRILVGTDTARTTFSLTSGSSVHDGLVQHETTSEPIGLSLCRNSSGAAPYLLLAATGGDTIGSTDPLADDDGVGIIAFSGTNGEGEFSTAAQIAVNVDAPVTGTGTEMPGRITFWTTPDGQRAPRERMRLTNNGLLGIGTDDPLTELDISAATDCELRVASRDDSTATLTLVNNGSSNRALIAQDASLRIMRGTTEDARINNTGKLLMGVTTQIDTSAGTKFTAANSSGGRLLLGRSSSTITDNQLLGRVQAWGRDGGTWVLSAYMDFRAFGTHTATDRAATINFFTVPNNSVDPAEVLVINNSGTLTSLPTYNSTTTSTTNLLRISSGGLIQRSTSSIQYKTNVEDLEDSYADAILNLRPVWYRSTCEGDNPNHSHYGLIAEEVAQIEPRICSFKEYENSIDEEGQRVLTPLETPVVDGVDYAALTPLLLNLIKRQKTQIENLETRLTALENS